MGMGEDGGGESSDRDHRLQRPHVIALEEMERRSGSAKHVVVINVVSMRLPKWHVVRKRKTKTRDRRGGKRIETLN